MKRSANILLYSVMLICCATCTKIIEIDFPTHEPKLVVNSLFTDGQRIRVHLSKSASAFDYSTPTVENGLVRLFCNDEEIDTLIFNNGYNKFFYHLLFGIKII